MLYSQYQDSLTEKINRLHLQKHVWLNALKVILTSLNIEFYECKVIEDDNVVPRSFNGYQLSPSMVETLL